MARSSLKNIIQLLDEDLNNSGTPESEFLRDLKKTIEKDNAATRRKGSNYHKPSGMHCMRAMYYQRVEAEKDLEDTPYTLVGICNSGTDIHEHTQVFVSKMKDYGFDCQYIDVGQFVTDRNIPDVKVIAKSGMETKLFHESLQMSFLCDGIIKYKGKYYILEIKTEISNKWYNRRDVDPKHYDQATAYSTALGLDDVIFVYINRDNLDMKAFMFTPSKDMKKELTTKILTCEDYVSKHITPPKPAGIEPSQCQKWYCKYRTQCRKDG